MMKLSYSYYKIPQTLLVGGDVAYLISLIQKTLHSLAFTNITSIGIYIKKRDMCLPDLCIDKSIPLF